MANFFDTIDVMAAYVASRPAFIARTGAAGAAAALARVHYQGLESTGNIRDLLPCAILDFGDTVEWEAQEGGAGTILRLEELSFELSLGDIDRQPSARPGPGAKFFHDPGDRDFASWVGQMIAELAENSGEDSLPDIKRISMMMKPSRCSQEEETSFGVATRMARFRFLLK